MKDEQRDVRLAQSGDLDAFERLYRAYLPHVHRLARWLLGTEDVDDVIQDAFLRVWEKLDTFDERSALATWLHRVAIRVILRHRERTARYESQEVRLVDEWYGATTETLGLRIDLEAAVSALPERARTVFVLHEIQGYRHREIARLMNTSVATSRTQLHRARELMRAQFRDILT